uniref:ubiquitinyl hydrolase 1 n=1 Tax=Pseudo-nitzschia multistriata TaxID=183589 RepID=A0A448ZNE9_9STRA
MPISEACDILGEDRVKRIVSGIFMFQTNQQSPNRSYTKEQLRNLEEAFAEKADVLVQAMMFVPGKVLAKKSGGVQQAMMLMKAMDMSSSALSSTDGADQIPAPIRNSWKSLLTTRSLMLDKATIIRFLVPSCAQPHTGPGGHMGLFDCLVYAVQIKPSLTTTSTTSASTPLVTIPDIIIFFAVCQKYWDLQGQSDPDVIPSFSGDDPAIKNMSQLMFLVYDGYRKNSVIGRDTIHRFMSDVYGDESFKTSAAKDVLGKMFTNPNSPLTGREFRAGISQTMSYTPTPSHFLLDWMATLAQAIMPPHLSKSSNDNDDDTEGADIGRNLPDSAAVLLQKMDKQRRWLPEICEKYFLAEFRLYEIKRRFHSLVESNTNIIRGDPMRAAVNQDGGNSNGTADGRDRGNVRRKSGVNSNAPKHVIPAHSFLRKVCHPSEEMGHGGFLPKEIAERIFESVARSLSSLGESDGVGDESKEDPEMGTCYWDLCHVLQFGGMALRSKDKDESLVKWIMQLFGNRGQNTLNRMELGDLMVCLCKHADFRKRVDRPKMDIADDSDNEEEENTDGPIEMMVNTLSALDLALVPQSFARTKSEYSSKVPVNELVDHFLETVEAKEDIVTEEQFLRWYNETEQYSRQRLGPLIVDIRLIAGVIFGVPPKLASLEYLLVKDIQERHRKRYPPTDVSRRGPRGTIWYLLDATWYKAWSELINVVRNTQEDCEDLRDMSSTSSSPRRLGQINNTKLLRENGSLALRTSIKWQHDYEILPPLGWSALQAWYDGGPPVSRTVVPYNSGTSSSGIPNSRGRQSSLRTDNEIELYPLFVTMFLCDSSSRGEARPFQQGVPVSRVTPIRMLLIQLCKEMDADPNMCRLWVMEPSGDPDQNENNDWLLNVDLNIDEQRKNRVGVNQNGTSNITLLLELKNEETDKWPRGIDGKNWMFRKGDSNTMETGDGIVGLYNMGNTCYLNSSIQCLSHTPIFRDYFTSKCYLNDINTTNPLGHEGQLAQVSAVLINSIWKRFNQQQPVHQPKRIIAPGSYFPVNAPALTPKTLKESLGKFNEHFAGNEQHDAQELLAFLLGGLSEDLNRIQVKPYIEAPDSDGRPDSELADIWWANHLKREMSIVVAMFTGQYKSLLKCKTCKYESARFEPFSFLQLPLPEDDTIPVSLIYYSSEPSVGITKYSVRVHNNGTLYDVLISLAKVIHSDKQASDSNISDDSGKFSHIEKSEAEEEIAKQKSAYAKIAQNMAIVDMREGYIFKIAPNVWRLPDLQNKDTGELPMLHVYGLEPLPETSDIDCQEEDEEEIKEKTHEEDSKSSEDTAENCAFLAFAQRRSELLSKELIHPLTHQVFGIPLLLRVADLDCKTGSEVYDLVAKHLKPLVPSGALKFLTNPEPILPDCEVESSSTGAEDEKSKDEIRENLEKATSDTEEVSAGMLPRYGFRLRLASREGRRCSICPWYECCIGCLVPDDSKPTVVANGDSIVIDWHFAVDVATAGFGIRANQADPSFSRKPDNLAGVVIKDHISCGVGLKKGQGDVITLEDCLDAFAEEEKIPEAYCSKCKDFKIQTKRMSLWRLPPVVIIQLKRFQFTQHMRRKLRDFVQFPVEGLDLSRIMATDGATGSPEKKKTSNQSSKSEKAHSQEEKKAFASDETTEEISSHINDDNGRGEKLYDLYGVVHHQGALSGGHYVASLKSDLDGQWRLFNDAQVYEIHSRDVVDSSAYILFYIRRDVASQKLSDFWDVRKRVGEGLTEEEMDELMKGGSDRCVIS